MHTGDRTDISPLLDVLNHFHPLSPGTTDFLKKNVFQLSLGKGEILLRAGQICENLYFIQKGVVRGFFREGKNEITTWITAENEIATSITSLDLEIPAFENMQVIEDSNFLVLSSAALKTLYEVFPEFNIVGRKILQQYYRDAERRAYFVRLRDAQSKYALFLDYYHHLANRIPLKHIASFLGITMETLSRVRGRMLPNRSSRHKKNDPDQ